MFKPKNESKILIKKQNNTLDYKHEEYTKNIEDITETLHTLVTFCRVLPAFGTTAM